jgi:hypothetical protein
MNTALNARGNLSGKGGKCCPRVINKAQGRITGLPDSRIAGSRDKKRKEKKGKEKKSRPSEVAGSRKVRKK